MCNFLPAIFKVYRLCHNSGGTEQVCRHVKCMKIQKKIIKKPLHKTYVRNLAIFLCLHNSLILTMKNFRNYYKNCWGNSKINKNKNKTRSAEIEYTKEYVKSCTAQVKLKRTKCECRSTTSMKAWILESLNAMGKAVAANVAGKHVKYVFWCNFWWDFISLCCGSMNLDKKLQQKKKKAEKKHFKKQRNEIASQLEQQKPAGEYFAIVIVACVKRHLCCCYLLSHAYACMYVCVLLLLCIVVVAYKL